MKSSVKLTMKDARSVVNQVFPGVKLEREITAPDVMIFRGTTGPDGLKSQYKMIGSTVTGKFT